MTSTSTPGGHSPNFADAQEFAATLFQHEAIDGLRIGGSVFPPRRGKHTWHPTAHAAAAWAIGNAGGANVYFRMTPVRDPPAAGRGKADVAAAVVGVHGDLDIADVVHKKGNLPSTVEEALQVVERVGIKPTLIVHSGHGLQPHWLLAEPVVFRSDEERARAANIAARFDATLQAAADALGFTCDPVGDLARILRVPGTLNLKRDPVPVTILSRSGPRYALEEIEDVAPEVVADAGGFRADGPGAGSVGFIGSDDELLEAARRSRNGLAFRALFDQGDPTGFGNDASRADWHLVGQLASWCGPNPQRIDRLFRRSHLMRTKWDEVHSGDGETYGAMTIGRILATRQQFYRPRLRLPIVVVSDRQLRDQSGAALEALESINTPPTVFQRGTDVARVRKDETDGQWIIESIGVNQMVGMLTRSADFVRMQNGQRIGVEPPQAVAKDILALPAWRFPPLDGVVSCPRVRPDGTILCRPGYDAATKLYLATYEGHETFEVPADPTDADVKMSRSMILELLQDFPFVDQSSRANAIAMMLTPVVRSAINGCVPVAAIDAFSKQGTGKGLLVKAAMLASTGRIPVMTAIPEDEPEWRKSLTALLQTGNEVIVFDNSTASFIESGVWANAITAEVFDDRLLGLNKRAKARVRCTWMITGNGMVFGGDLVRRVYHIVLDARCERPEDRTGFKLELPQWAEENRLGLLRACLVLCRRWWSDGCPTPRLPLLGSFEEWTRILGGVLEHVGIEGFLKNRVAYREAADTDRGEWTGFVAAIADYFPVGHAFTTKQLVDGMRQDGPLSDSLPAYLADARQKTSGFATKLGRALQKKAGAVFGLHRLESAGRDSHSKCALFRIQVAGHAAGGAGDCGGSPLPPV